MTLRRRIPELWAVLLSVLLLGPALAPGFVLLRDMVWVPNLGLRDDVLGFGTALPRAVPSDAVIAVLDELVPGQILQKLLLLGALVLAGTGASTLVGGGTLARLVAVSVAVWNPFVVERLGMGHWPVLLGYGAVPWLAVAGRRIARGERLPAWLPLLLIVGSLSASAGIVSAVTLLATGLRRGRTAVALGLLVAAANAPWVAAGLAKVSIASGAGGFEVFATSGDGLPAPLAVLTLGGIWNADVVPVSRGGVLAWVGLCGFVTLAGLGARDWWRRTGRRQAVALLALWALGTGIALLSWAAPAMLADLAAVVPGVGVLRDGSRSLGLALPVVAGLIAAGAVRLAGWVRAGAPRASLSLAVVLLPLAVLPDAVWGLRGELRAVDYPAEWLDVGAALSPEDGDALLLPLGNYRAPAWNGRRPMIDPLARLLRPAVLLDDDLVVGGVVVAGEDPRVRAVRVALAEPSPTARSAGLRAVGIGQVITHRDAGPPAPEIAGQVTHEGPLLQVRRLLGDVTERTASRREVALQAGGWSVFALLLIAGPAMVARRRVGNVTSRRRSPATVRT